MYFKKVLKFFIVFLIIFGWIFSGWPRIWNNPPIPPEIEEAKAVSLTLVGQTTAEIAYGVTDDVTLPGSPQEDDIVIVGLGSDYNANECVINTSGYTEIYNSGDANPVSIVAYKIMGATPDSVINVTKSGSLRNMAVVIQVWRGLDTTTPIDATPTTAAGSSGMPDSPSYTPVTDGALVFSIGLLDDDSIASSVTVPSGFSNLVAGDADTSGSAGVTIMIASLEQETAQTIDPDAFGGSGSDQWDAVTFALRPASTVAAPTVTTQAASNVETTTATGNGNITDTGGENANRRGFAYMVGTSGDPTTSDSVAYDDGDFGTGAYTKGLTSLSTGTNYRVRAYAVNSGGTGYGTTVQILTKPAAPTSVSATDGAHTDKVTITWTKSTGATDYHVWRDTTDLGSVGDVATFDDTGADAPTITPGSAVASDGTSSEYVALSLSGTSTNNGTTHTYKVVASNATGDSADSDTDTGYRGVGSLSYQWQRSAGDSDASYSNIDGATDATYNDTDAPANGDGRYYKCVLNATGASQQTSAANRGYRIAVVVSVTFNRESFTYGFMPDNTSSSTLSLWSGAGITATNDGNVTEDFDIYGANTANWTLAGSVGSDQYVHKFCNDTDDDCNSPPTNYTSLTTNPVTLKDGVVEDGTVVFQLQITTPNPSTVYTQQSAVVTIQASQSP